MNLFKKIGVAIVGMAMAIGVGVGVNSIIDKASISHADGNYESVYYLDGTKTGGSSGYGSESDITQNTIVWKVMANTQQNPWRIGGQSLSNEKRPVYSTSAISGDVKKMVINVGTANSVNVDSLTVLVASDCDFANVVDTKTPTFVASSDIEVTPTTGKSWNNCYYKVIFEVTISSTSNKYVQLKGINFFVESVKQDSSVTINTSNPFVLTVGGSSETLDVSTEPSGLALSYSSGNTNIATVNSSGSVSPVASGISTITASFAGNSTYKASSDDVEAIVLKQTSLPATGVITLTSSDLNKIGSGNSYADYNGIHYASEDNSNGEMPWRSIQAMPGTGDGAGKIQMQKDTGCVYNCVSLENIISVNVETSGTYTLTFGSSIDDITHQLGDGCGFFKITSGSSTLLITSITITYAQTIEDPTTLTMNTKQLDLETEQTAEEALTFTTDSPGATFAWHTEDSDLATVENGVVTTKTTAGSVKIYVYFDSNENGQFDLTDLNDYCTVNITIPEVDYSSVTYGGVGTLITESNAAQLIANNKKIVLAYNATNTIAGALSGTILTAVTNSQSSPITFSNDKTTVTIGDGTSEVSIMVLTLETNGDYYSLKMKSGEYLGCGTGAASNLSAQENKDDRTWNVTYSGITANTDNENFLQFNSSSPRFKTYKTSSNMKAIQLYSFVEYTDEALAYAETFIKGNGTANTCAATIQNWTSLETTFNTTLSDGAKNLFKTATHNPSDTYTTANEYTIQHAVARYDDALLKHTELRTHEFMDRVAAGTLSYSSYVGGLVKDNTSTSIVIVIVSLASISAFGAFLFLKKRKEQ